MPIEIVNSLKPNELELVAIDSDTGEFYLSSCNLSSIIKLKHIQLMREIGSLGLAEAKTFVETYYKVSERIINQIEEELMGDK